MKLLPYEDFDIITKLSPDDAWDKLKNSLVPLYPDPLRDFVLGSIDTDYPFMGNIYNGKFWLEPVWFNGRRHSAPVIKGTIDIYKDGSMVKVRVRPSFVNLFPALFLLGFEVLLIAGAFSGAGLAVVFLAIFTPVISYLAFVSLNASSVVHIKADLVKIFNG